MLENFIEFVKSEIHSGDFVPLHQPAFFGNEEEYVLNTIRSTFVSSVGEYVDNFEIEFAKAVNTDYAVAVVNGSSALHLAQILVGVEKDTEVITQSLTFVATGNTILYNHAFPIFLDVDKDTYGLSPDALRDFLNKNAILKNNQPHNKISGRRISACIPVHVFGMPCRIDKIEMICQEWNIPLIEDATEAIGSTYNGKSCGGFGKLGVFSFNGNKTITCGGGGCIVTNDKSIAQKAKHLSTQAKVAHPFNYVHDEMGFNYRMPNINAALALAQLENLDKILKHKRDIHLKYVNFFKDSAIRLQENEEGKSASNFWLNAIELENKQERSQWLETCRSENIQCRPVWDLLTNLPYFSGFYTDELIHSKVLNETLMNIPSGIYL